MKAMVSDKLVPLSEDILTSYLPLDAETQARNITAWTPVVREVLQGVCGLLEVQQQEQNGGTASSSAPPQGLDRDSLVRTFYPLAVDLLARDALPSEITQVLRDFFSQAGYAMRVMSVESEKQRRQRIRDMRERERVERESVDPLPSPSSMEQQEHPYINGGGRTSSNTTEPLITRSQVSLGAVDGGDGHLTKAELQEEASFAPTPPVMSQQAEKVDPMNGHAVV
jgi:brefeldin A-inhibited guanine nucleotide-exchange protein